jgi:hypothetical protein
MSPPVRSRDPKGDRRVSGCGGGGELEGGDVTARGGTLVAATEVVVGDRVEMPDGKWLVVEAVAVSTQPGRGRVRVLLGDGTTLTVTVDTKVTVRR